MSEIHGQLNLHAQDIRLEFAGEELYDEDYIGQFNIEDESTIYQVSYVLTLGVKYQYNPITFKF